MARTGQPASRHIAAIQRAVVVLDVLADADAALGTNEVARRAGINPSTVSRVLATLVDGGLVEHVPGTGHYRLGLRLVHLGHAALARVDIRELARPELQALADTTGETATLCLPGEEEALTVDFAQSARSVQSVARLGRPSVGHATAVGKVLLAHRGEVPRRALAAFTDRTITDRARLGEELTRTAERGWGEAIGEREPDLNAVAVPVLHGGELLAILGVQGPAARFDPPLMRAAVDRLRVSAQRLTSSRGGRPRPTAAG